MGVRPQVRGALCLLADLLLQVVLLSLWPWLPNTGHDRQPSAAGSAATKLQEADVKGDWKSWGRGGGGGPQTQKPAKEDWRLQTQKLQRVVFNPVSLSCVCPFAWEM